MAYIVFMYLHSAVELKTSPYSPIHRFLRAPAVCAKLSRTLGEIMQKIVSSSCLVPLLTALNGTQCHTIGNAASRGIISESSLAENQCPFAALGLDRGASAEELRHRYLQLAKRLHPDATNGNVSSSTSTFIALRKTYERALQLQQRETEALGQSHHGWTKSWRMGEWVRQCERKSVEAEAKRREWMKDQETIRAFWASHDDIERQILRSDSEYASAMASLLEKRLHTESQDSRHNLSASDDSLEPGEHLKHAPLGAPDTLQWKRAFEEEMQMFGLKNTCRTGYVPFRPRFKRRTTNVKRTWTSRTQSTPCVKVGCLAALAAGIAAIAVSAAMLQPDKTENDGT